MIMFIIFRGELHATGQNNSRETENIKLTGVMPLCPSDVN